MKIQLSDQVALKLMTIANLTEGLEFSGFGFVEISGGDFMIYDAVILDIGNEVFTEIEPSLLFNLMERTDARNMKLWIHRHPLGNGLPGKHNWSGTDNRTIAETPLGGHPDLVKWSCSMVLTPRGWVGRIDNHLKNITRHIEVIPQCNDAYKTYDEIITRKSPVDRHFLYQTPSSEFWGDTYLQFEELVKGRFTERVLQDKGITQEEMTSFLLDSFYEGDEELVYSFLDPAIPDDRIFSMIEERNSINGSYPAH